VLDQAGGSIAYRFHARDAHLVLSSGAREPIPFRVLLDGETPGQSHGVDVDLGIHTPKGSRLLRALLEEVGEQLVLVHVRVSGPSFWGTEVRLPRARDHG
jgi:Thioredoxin like C-terminal domain